ncbi:ankyrin [Dendrothele bispora CBS 962.96]|uniref:Ankyrin n=1 Tax=Dendrothele bispora (strain CBS 962.96) TaxID=1314807 RepID=A0A4S8M468_DENBC|nr:ankyrin [Dendrothele bispora CBS 962.96]
MMNGVSENHVEPIQTQSPSNVSSLPSSTLDFAGRMFDAARQGNSELLLAAVDAGLPINLTNHQGNTLLMLSTYAGHLDLSRGLLTRGADPERLNDAGQSIVAGAVFKGHHALVRLLIEHGANPRHGKPNAIESVWMFVKDEEGSGEGDDRTMGRQELLDLMGAKEEDKERMEREGVRVMMAPPGSE